jgi:glycosyltransferase involved in cell wall biosynthesis
MEEQITANSRNPRPAAVPAGDTPRLKILVFYETVYPVSMGGIETRNFELASALARRGHEVTLAAFGPTPALPEGLPLRGLSLGPPARLYNRGGRRSGRQALRFGLAAARIGITPFDVVETAAVPFAHLWPLALRCRLSGRPLVVTWYEVWGPYWKDYVGRLQAPFHRLVEWLSAQLGTAAMAPSEFTTRRLSALRRTGPALLLPCGVDVARVRRAAGGGSREGPPLVFAGRLLHHKRVDLLLAAVREIPGLYPGRRLLTVFGEGPERQRLMRLAAELGIEDRVEFRGHVRTNEEVWEAFGRAKLAVQPSDREGFGLFPLEAMAAGLPVVYCPSPESAVGELVRDGVDGLQVARDPVALGRAVESLCADPAAIVRLRAGARRRAEDYDWDVVAARFEALCRDAGRRRRTD